jgi:hypothetical protein
MWNGFCRSKREAHRAGFLDYQPKPRRRDILNPTLETEEAFCKEGLLRFPMFSVREGLIS